MICGCLSPLRLRMSCVGDPFAPRPICPSRPKSSASLPRAPRTVHAAPETSDPRTPSQRIASYRIASASVSLFTLPSPSLPSPLLHPSIHPSIVVVVVVVQRDRRRWSLHCALAAAAVVSLRLRLRRTAAACVCVVALLSSPFHLFSFPSHQSTSTIPPICHRASTQR